MRGPMYPSIQPTATKTIKILSNVTATTGMLAAIIESNQKAMMTIIAAATTLIRRLISDIDLFLMSDGCPIFNDIDGICTFVILHIQAVQEPVTSNLLVTACTCN